MSKEKEEAVKQEGDFKMKKKPKKLVKDNMPIKVDMAKPKQEEQKEIPKVDMTEQEEKAAVIEDVTPQPEPIAEDPVVEEAPVQVIEEKVEEPQQEEEKPADPVVMERPTLPENIDKLVKFMDETGGTVEDYVRINADYSNVDETTLLREYYKKTKPHFSADDVNFHMEENFKFDEEVDEERVIRRKKLAYKEEVAKARGYLNDVKDKYYAEIKQAPTVTNDMKKAMDFFNRHNEQQKLIEQNRKAFRSATSDLLTDNFEGFDFSLGEKKFRYKINNASNVANEQSDISNFVKKFLDKDGKISNHKEYHKSLYAANNADKVASHFYEQGKADAVKEMMGQSKNITNDKLRPAAPTGEIAMPNGMKIKSVSGAAGNRLKVLKAKTK